ncbi:hypothetical protein D3C77_405690 [compost metagenome]
MRVQLALRREKAAQAGGAAADLLQGSLLRRVLLVGFKLLFFQVDHFREVTEQRLNLLGQQLRHAQQQFGGSLRATAFGQLLQQLVTGAQWPQAQGNHPLCLGENAYRDHVFGLCARIEVDPAQKQQHLLFWQGQQPWAGIFFEEQVAGELAQAAVAAQPGPGLGMAAIPMQPEALLWLQLQVVQFSSSNRTRTAFTIEHQGMH